MTSEQRCGTCRWAEPTRVNHWLRHCEAPAPNSTRGHGRSVMLTSEGADCPCYQPATQPQTEDCPDAD